MNHLDNFFHLPLKEDLLLFLIQKELQGTRFTATLDKAGFDTSLYQLDLGQVILTLAGFTERTDELWEWYYNMMEAAAEKVILDDHDTAREAAMEMYRELKRKLGSDLTKKSYLN